MSSYIYIKNYDLKLDGFYARLLYNLNGLYDYIKTKSKFGMTKTEIYELVELIRSDKNTDFLCELRNCYYQTGFLIFVDILNEVYIYTENSYKFNEWYENAKEEGPTSSNVYEYIESIDI